MPTSPSAGDPLSALRDIHLPPEPGFWPPAPGWWILALVLVLVAIALAWWQRSVARRRRPQREALRALADLRDALARERRRIGSLPRARPCCAGWRSSSFPQASVAGLSGRPWLEFLVEHGGGSGFAAAEAELLLSAPYASCIDADEAERVIGSASGGSGAGDEACAGAWTRSWASSSPGAGPRPDRAASGTSHRSDGIRTEASRRTRMPW